MGDGLRMIGWGWHTKEKCEEVYVGIVVVSGGVVDLFGSHGVAREEAMCLQETNNEVLRASKGQ